MVSEKFIEKEHLRYEGSIFLQPYTGDSKGKKVQGRIGMFFRDKLLAAIVVCHYHYREEKMQNKNIRALHPFHCFSTHCSS